MLHIGHLKKGALKLNQELDRYGQRTAPRRDQTRAHRDAHPALRPAKVRRQSRKQQGSKVSDDEPASTSPTTNR